MAKFKKTAVFAAVLLGLGVSATAMGAVMSAVDSVAAMVPVPQPLELINGPVRASLCFPVLLFKHDLN